MRLYNIIIAALLVSLFGFHGSSARAQTDVPVVRAVLFYSPTCGHCEHVINGTLLPMMEKYGEQLQIIAVDVSQPNSQELFSAAMQMFGLEQTGVPFLVFDKTFLMGSVDIPEKFPGVVETYLAQGGLDWPEIPGLRESLAQPSETGQAAPDIITPTALPAIDTAEIISPEVHAPSWAGNFARDRAGNTLAVLVLAGMLISSVWAILLFQRTNGVSLQDQQAWVIPILCIFGSGIAGYLAYVETTQTAAICGPVGDCNAVQQSPYARLFGILPIGVLGLIGYTAIFIAWLLARYARGELSDIGSIVLITLTASGTLFSIYLTLLEPFVIGATCAWCLTSAVLMTVLMLLSVGPAKLAFSRKQ